MNFYLSVDHLGDWIWETVPHVCRAVDSSTQDTAVSEEKDKYCRCCGQATQTDIQVFHKRTNIPFDFAFPPPRRWNDNSTVTFNGIECTTLNEGPSGRTLAGLIFAVPIVDSGSLANLDKTLVQIQDYKKKLLDAHIPLDWLEFHFGKNLCYDG
jgi:hypothetical protein